MQWNIYIVKQRQTKDRNTIEFVWFGALRFLLHSLCLSVISPCQKSSGGKEIFYIFLPLQQYKRTKGITKRIIL